jgi:shikimate dehydrogenase
VTVSGKTKVYGVIGDPIEHSLSPVMHNAAFRAQKLDCTFVAFKVAPAEIANAVSGMRALGIQGLSVTMPHKKAVISYLDEVDETARFLNAVNTVHNRNGTLFGFNTDGTGALRALQENGVSVKGKKVLLLGTGGAGRAIAYAIAKEASELVILNRTAKPAMELASFLKKAFKAQVSGDPLLPITIKNALAYADILINATSVGMKPEDDLTPVPWELLKPRLAVMDIVYNPIETQLVKDAKAAGANVVSGVEMLIYQGAASFEIWTGKTAPISVMRKAALDHLRRVLA